MKKPTTEQTVRAHGRNIAVLFDKPEKEKVSDGGIILAGSDKPDVSELVTGIVKSVGDGGALGGVKGFENEGTRVVPDATLVGKRVYYQLINAHPIPLDNGDQMHIIDCEDAVAVEIAS